jgi:hypothetical protein
MYMYKYPMKEWTATVVIVCGLLRDISTSVLRWMGQLDDWGA